MKTLENLKKLLIESYLSVFVALIFLFFPSVLSGQESGQAALKTPSAKESLIVPAKKW
jgi:hypothetical protein